ncbi:MAG: 3'-5' exoribonuclease [SAR324 cluster bacterium]|nr:3'-5' exoribonuclease [SAR324 cluster bacterium]
MNTKIRLKHLWILANVVFLALGLSLFAFVWGTISLEDQQGLITILYPYRVELISAPIILLGFFFFGSKWLLNSFWIPLKQVTEEAELMLSGNFSYRIDPNKSPVFQPLITLLNREAENLEILSNQVEQQIINAKTEVEKERNILARLIDELREGVIVCNKNGLILLYNTTVNTILNDSQKGTPNDQKTCIGLGRSISTIISHALFEHHIEELLNRQKAGNSSLIQHFVMWIGSQLIRVEILGFLSETEVFGGFIVVFKRLSRKADIPYFEQFEKQQTIKIRTSLASVRTSIETILSYPSLEESKKAQLLSIINDQSVQLTEFINQNRSRTFQDLRQLSQQSQTMWSLQETHVRAWLSSMIQNEGSLLEISVDLELDEEDCSVLMSQYLISQSLLFLINQLKREFSLDRFLCRFQQSEQLVTIDLIWSGPVLSEELFAQWLIQPVHQEMTIFTVSEVLHRHNAELWLDADEQWDEKKQTLRFLIHKVDDRDPDYSPGDTIALGNPPIIYDFGLMNQGVKGLEHGDVKLTELSYTVFDMETTGLDPGGGDEIISIGAIRIVNGRVLEKETFEQLVNPHRSIPVSSIVIHGIQPENLKDKPSIHKILPQFFKFAEGTILVAHNAAFDMRFLQLKEDITQVYFKNPVLDTLLLSEVVHPYQDLHCLEEIAKRFHLKVEKRHSALADAFLTANIFLKLIPLLNRQGIHTLKEAQFAEKETYFSKLKY